MKFLLISLVLVIFGFMMVDSLSYNRGDLNVLPLVYYQTNPFSSIRNFKRAIPDGPNSLKRAIPIEFY